MARQSCLGALGAPWDCCIHKGGRLPAGAQFCDRSGNAWGEAYHQAVEVSERTAGNLRRDLEELGWQLKSHDGEEWVAGDGVRTLKAPTPHGLLARVREATRSSSADARQATLDFGGSR